MEARVTSTAAPHQSLEVAPVPALASHKIIQPIVAAPPATTFMGLDSKALLVEPNGLDSPKISTPSVPDFFRNTSTGQCSTSPAVPVPSIVSAVSSAVILAVAGKSAMSSVTAASFAGPVPAELK